MFSGEIGRIVAYKEQWRCIPCWNCERTYTQVIESLYPSSDPTEYLLLHGVW